MKHESIEPSGPQMMKFEICQYDMVRAMLQYAQTFHNRQPWQIRHDRWLGRLPKTHARFIRKIVKAEGIKLRFFARGSGTGGRGGRIREADECAVYTINCTAANARRRIMWHFTPRLAEKTLREWRRFSGPLPSGGLWVYFNPETKLPEGFVVGPFGDGRAPTTPARPLVPMWLDKYTEMDEITANIERRLSDWRNGEAEEQEKMKRLIRPGEMLPLSDLSRVRKGEKRWLKTKTFEWRSRQAHGAP